MAAGDPTGGDLCSGTTDGGTLPQSPTWESREVSLGAGTALTSGRKYAIVITAPSAYDTSSLYFNNETVGSGGGQVWSTNNGSSWTQFSTRDLWFKTKATGVEKDTNTFTGAGFWYCGQTYLGGHVFTAGSDYTITSVVLNLARNGDVAIGTITVSIRNVEGEETLPTKATNPTPTNSADDVSLNLTTLTWEDGGDTTTYNIYYGTESGNLSLVASGVELGSESFTVTDITNGSPYEYLITRYWRIDSVNGDGTTEGDEWSFTTIQIDPPAKTYWYSTDGYYYRLLPDGDPPPTGTEDVDYEILAGYLPNFINTNRRLVAATRNSIYYEDI